MGCAEAAQMDRAFDRVLEMQRVLQGDIQGVKDNLRKQIPRSVVIAQTQASAKSLAPQNQSFTFCLIHRIFAVVSSPGTLTINTQGTVLTFPVNPGAPPFVFSEVPHVGLPLTSIDGIQLSQASNG